MTTISTREIITHSFLFLLTLITTTLAGAEWMFPGSFFSEQNPLGWHHFWQGLQFSLPFLGILTIHEFGHYFYARHYRLDVSLPYYIPLYLGFLLVPSIGTAGAFIRIKTPPYSRKEFFDIGIAGPLAGFVAALAVLWYGFTNLPPADFIYTIHPEYAQYGANYATKVYKGLPAFQMGNNLLFSFFKQYVATPGLVPNDFEIMHYPYLLAGFLALVFTAMNLLPIGQLDGGHVLYGLVGSKWHTRISPIILFVLVLYAGLGSAIPISAEYDKYTPDKLIQNLFYLGFLYIVFTGVSKDRLNALTLALLVFAIQYILASFTNFTDGFSGLLLFAFIIGRFLGVYHPPVYYDAPLDLKRKILGWFALFVFVICCTPSPMAITIIK